MHYEQFADGTVKCIENEIPFDIPDSWAWCRITVVSLEIFAGGDKPDDFSKERTINHCVPIYSNGIENNGLYGYTNKARVSSPSLTISARGTIGYCCIRNEPFFPIVRLITIVPVGIDLLYLKFVFETLIETGEGSSIPQLTVPSIKPKLIPVPPLNEQVKIASMVNNLFNILSKLDSNKKELVTVITSIKSKILDLAICGKLVPQDPNDEPASVLLERIRVEKEELIKQGKIKRDKKESVIFKGEDNSYYEKIGDEIICIDEEIPFDIPDNWGFSRLKSIWELLSGRDLAPNQYNDNKVGIPYITGASNFVNGKVSLVRWTPEPQIITNCGDLLITCKGTIGEMAINDFGRAHIARQIMAIKNIYNLNANYLSLCLQFYIESIKLAAKGLIPGISREDILNIILPIPPEEYQVKVVKVVHRYKEILNSIEASLN